MAQRVGPASLHQQQVAFIGTTPAALPAFAEHVVQRNQCGAFLADKQHAGGLAVEPVRQLEIASLGPLASQGFDYPEAHPAAAVHGDTGGFIDNQQRVVFKEDRKFRFDFRASDDFFLTRGDPDRRQPQHVARLKTIGGIHALAVDTDFPAADDPVEVAFGNALADLQ